jgi:Zn-dependent protease
VSGKSSSGVFTLLFAAGPKLYGVVGKLAKSAKVAKVGMAGATMAAYSWLFTWQFALIILFALVVHESGHVWAMRKCGIATKGFYLIPFVGGSAISTEKIDNRWTEYLIVMAGPLFGLGSALVPLVLYWITDYGLWAAVAAWIATLNLINLIPILPLDGGKILKSIAFSANSKAGLVIAIVGLVACAVLLCMTGSALLGFLLVVGCFETYFEWKGRDSFIMPIKGLNFPGAIVLYLLLAVALIAVVHAGTRCRKARLPSSFSRIDAGLAPCPSVADPPPRNPRKKHDRRRQDPVRSHRRPAGRGIAAPPRGGVLDLEQGGCP